MYIWFDPLSSTYFFSLFSTCELVPYANLGYNVYLFMIVTPPIFWKLRRCFVYGLKRAGGLGMILKLFSTRDLSLLAHAKYRAVIFLPARPASQTHDSHKGRMILNHVNPAGRIKNCGEKSAFKNLQLSF